jgi:hypothetical protein
MILLSNESTGFFSFVGYFLPCGAQINRKKDKCHAAAHPERVEGQAAAACV